MYEKYPAMPLMFSRVNHSLYYVIPLCYLYFFHLAQYIAYISAAKLNNISEVFMPVFDTQQLQILIPSLSPESLLIFSPLQGRLL